MRKLRKHHNIGYLSIIMLLLFLYNAAGIDLSYQKERNIDPEYPNDLLRVPLKLGSSNPNNRNSGYRPEQGLGKKCTAWQVLDQADIEQEYYQPNRKLFDLPDEVSSKRINVIDVIEEAIEKVLLRASVYFFFNFDPGQVIIQIRGSTSYLRNPDGTIFWSGVRQENGKPELDVLVFLPEEWHGNSFIHITLSYFILKAIKHKFKSLGSSVFLDIQIKNMTSMIHFSDSPGIADKLLIRLTDCLVKPYWGISQELKEIKNIFNKCISIITGQHQNSSFATGYPYLPAKLYFGKKKALQAMLEDIRGNPDKYRSTVLKKYHQLFAYAEMLYGNATVKSSFKSAKLLLQLALMRGDQNDMFALLELIKGYAIGKSEDFTKLDSFLKRANPGFLPKDIEALVSQYSYYQTIYNTLYHKPSVIEDPEGIDPLYIISIGYTTGSNKNRNRGLDSSL